MSDKKFDNLEQYINTLPEELTYTKALLTKLFNDYKYELQYAERLKKSNSDAVMKWWSEEEIANLLNREIAFMERDLRNNSLSKADKYIFEAVTEEDNVSMKYECQKLLNDSKDKKDSKASFAIPKWRHHQECAWGYEKFISNVNVNIRIYNKQKDGGESK